MKTLKQYWLLKTEPEEFSIGDLQTAKKTSWGGVRNFQARNHLRAMQRGDECLVYHTGDEKSIVGIAKVASAPYPETDPVWTQVDIQFVKLFKTPVPLAQIKADLHLREMVLVKAPRLSVQPVSAKQFAYITHLATAQ